MELKFLLILIVAVVAIIGIIVMKKIEPNNKVYPMYAGVILMLYLLVITKGE